MKVGDRVVGVKSSVVDITGHKGTIVKIDGHRMILIEFDEKFDEFLHTNNVGDKSGKCLYIFDSDYIELIDYEPDDDSQFEEGFEE